MDRRRFLEGVVAGGAVAATATSTAKADADPRPQSAASLAPVADDAPREVDVVPAADRPASPSEWAAIAPYRAGDEVGLGWRVAGLSAVRLGAMTLALEHVDGERARAHLCARGRVPAGVAATDHLDVVLVNDGGGRAPTDEAIGRVLLTLARRIADHQAAQGASVPEGLLPHATRVRRYAHRRGLE